MESPLAFVAMHWDHELRGGCSAGVLACEFTGRLARCLCWRRDAATTRSRDGRATRFMESPLAIFAVHWDHEPKMHNLFNCKGGILRFMESVTPRRQRGQIVPRHPRRAALQI